MLDLQSIYRCTFEQISYLNTIWGITYLVGALGVGIYSKFNKYTVFMLCLIVNGLTSVPFANFKYLSILYVAYGINGIDSGIIDSFTTVWMIEIWETKCGPFAEALHFVISVGQIVATPLANQFLSTIVTNNGSDDVHTTPSRIWIPYLIVGVINIATGIWFGGIAIYRHRYYGSRGKKLTTIDNTSNNNNNIDSKRFSHLFIKTRNLFVTQLSSSKVGCAVLLMTCLQSAIMSTLVWYWQTYWTPFAQFSSDNLISKQLANNMLTAFQIAVAVSRAVFIPLSVYVSPVFRIYFSFVVLIVSVVLFVIYGISSLTILWLGNVLMGVGLGPIQASYYQLLRGILPVTNMFGAIATFLNGLFQAIFSAVLGHYIDNNPIIFIYLSVALLDA
ncbi:major facilitator superfamily domain-containing protein 4B-like [Oppia nitens]|uniref:major facilitator superfamily domain-containing protein 4B-like n=1 Tax=Oppia nitens TaxID=1686743 RepID=UPI0023D9D5F2|nr:major facilitator superfamily domain-containing protein 4B-like [Oppia nitens]